ncbi:MAG: LysR family transcriptional regulator [Rhodocyclaceae bacterium]
MRFHRLDLNLLLVLNALLEEGNVSHAARKLNVGQPALSAALARLRAHFDDPMFVKSGKKMVPTALAMSLAVPVRELLEQAERVARARATFDPAASPRRFSVAASDYTTTVLMPRAIGLLAREAPLVQLSLREVPMSSGLETQPVSESLDRRQHDFAISPLGAHSERHPSEVLLEDGYSCIARCDHPSVRGQLSAEQFCAATHVVGEFDDGRVSWLESEALEQAGLERRIGPVVDRFAMLGEVVAVTDCVATLPSRLARVMAARLPLQVMDVPAPLPPLVELLHWKPMHDTDPAMQWLRGLMHRAAQSV